MIPQTNRRIKTVPVPDLEADAEEFFRINHDLVLNSRSLLPSANWLVADDVSAPAATYDDSEALERALSEEEFRLRFSKMKMLMHAWVGSGGEKPPSSTVLNSYRALLKRWDPLGLWKVNVEESNRDSVLTRADLGTIMDLNFLFSFSRDANKKLTRILEVGAGYGRLPEAAYNIFGRSIQYVLIDAVPASLHFSRKYLQRACPDARIASYYDSDRKELRLEDHDIVVLPAWHFERLNTCEYDICINIESFQEMTQSHVDHYLQLFDSVAAENGLIYLSNARDYFFKGVWNYPKTWQKLLSANTPRSWTPSHPTEVFRKTTIDSSSANAALDAVLNFSLERESDTEAFVARNSVQRMIPPMLKKLRKRLAGASGA